MQVLLIFSEHSQLSILPIDVNLALSLQSGFKSFDNSEGTFYSSFLKHFDILTWHAGLSHMLQYEKMT